MQELLKIVLEKKERIYKARQEFKSDFAVLCFSLNLSYLFIKNNKNEVKILFEFALNLLKDNFIIDNIYINYNDFFALFSIKEDAFILKNKAMLLENEHSFSRLFDFDVYFKNNVIKIRKQARKCFVCDELALTCMRNNTHSKQEIYAKIDEFFDDFFVYLSYKYPIKNDFSTKALRALLYELSISPKLGLVDSLSSNSHKDMNFFTFIDSASELKWYFDCFYTLAYKSSKNDFSRLKKLGILAENAMFKATKNINTHKGALFLFAIMIFVCARCKKDLNFENISKISKKLCANLCSNELNKNLNSIGGICFKKYGIKGIRDEVEQGFINTFKAYNFYKKQDDFKELRTLFYISSIIDDTSLLKRCNYDINKYYHIKNTCKKLSLLKSKNYVKIIKKLNYFYVKDNLSFGGSADILSLVLFLKFINF